MSMTETCSIKQKTKVWSLCVVLAWTVLLVSQKFRLLWQHKEERRDLYNSPVTLQLLSL